MTSHSQSDKLMETVNAICAWGRALLANDLVDIEAAIE